MDGNKIVGLSINVYFCKNGFKYFIGYKDAKKIRLLNICLFCFLTKDTELLEKCNETREKVKNNTKKEFESESAFNDKYLKAKLKSYQEKISTNFHNNEISKEGSQFISLSVIYLFICFIYLFICLFV